MRELSEAGLSELEVREVLEALALKVEDVDEELAYLSFEVWRGARERGLTPAQCSSVVLGRRLGVPVLATAGS